MKNMISLVALLAFTLLIGWLIWGVGGRYGDYATGFILGATLVTLAGVWISTKGKTDEPTV